MASKRSLYKPAPESGVKSVEKMGSRKPLIQGRLVSSVLPDSMTVYASPSSTKQSMGTSRDSPVITATYEGLIVEGPWTPPRQAMARYSPTGQGATAQLDQIGRRSPPPASVGNVPRSLGPQSPPKPAPSRALDLSDSEAELHPRKIAEHQVRWEQGPQPGMRPTVFGMANKTSVRTHAGSRSVLMVDASGGRLDPEATEVTVQTGMVSSPAKVVCHAPSEGQKPDPRDTGSVEAAAKIAVDHVPSVLQSNGYHHHGSTIQDHPDDIIPTRGPPAVPSSAKKLAFEDTEDESGMSDTKGSLALKDSLIGKSRSNENLRAEKDSSAQSVRDKRKKKSNRSHVVPSRYMGSAHKASLSSMDARATKPSEKLMKKPLHKPPTSGLPSTRQRKPKSRKSMMPLAFSETPMDRGTGGKDMYTSTPAMDGSFFPANASNISSIGCDLSVLREDPTADLGSRLDETAHRRGKKGDARHPRELTQFDLDKMHARYMQWVFLESKMRKGKQEKEKEAMSQLYLLQQENEKLSGRRAELEMKLSRLVHANNLDQLLDIQKSGLGPVGASLGQFVSQFTTLAEALDTTRHQITTTGIHLPQNQEHFQDDLLSALSESEQLLTSIHSRLQEKTTKTSTFAKTLQALNKTVEAEDKEIKRCQQLLTKSSINAAHETSLRVQRIEGVLEE